ncbi:MAG: hypothetical protein JJU03_13800 [Idiomarina sp.]|nr:hypothetical protein [Idiomarina sp.]
MNKHNTQSVNVFNKGRLRGLWSKPATWMSVVVALTAVGFIGVATAADDKITRTHQIPVQGQSQLVIANGVGKVDVRHHDAPQIQLEVTIEAGRRGLLRRKVDISDMDISIDQTARRIRLELQEDNVTANWTVYVPAFEQIELKVGVGQLHTEWLDSALDVNVGVGDVRVYVDIDSLGEFSANVGVGSIQADGVHSYVSSRRIVTESGTGRGRGEHALDIEVGVGDIQVKAESPR